MSGRLRSSALQAYPGIEKRTLVALVCDFRLERPAKDRKISES